LDEINLLVQKNNDYHELKALNRFASIRAFFMSTQDFFSKEVRILIGFLCLQNYDLTLHEKFTHMNPIKLQEMEATASQLVKLPKEMTFKQIQNMSFFGSKNQGVHQTKETMVDEAQKPQDKKQRFE
jgi:hypothetical protein